jgi:hypothetical protein
LCPYCDELVSIGLDEVNANGSKKSADKQLHQIFSVCCQSLHSAGSHPNMQPNETLHQTTSHTDFPGSLTIVLWPQNYTSPLFATAIGRNQRYFSGPGIQLDTAALSRTLASGENSKKPWPSSHRLNAINTVKLWRGFR